MSVSVPARNFTWDLSILLINDDFKIIVRNQCYTNHLWLRSTTVKADTHGPIFDGRQCCVAAWRSGNSVGRINEVTLRRTRLVLGWVTCTGSTPGGGTLFRYVTSHAGRLSLSSCRGR